MALKRSEIIIIIIISFKGDGVICSTKKLLDSKIVEDILVENYFIREGKSYIKIIK